MTVEKLHVAPENDELLRHAMLLDNEVRFSEDGNILGDSTETALVNYAFQKGNKKEESERQFPFVAKLPFDSVRMRMSTLHFYQGKWILFVKGAPLKVLEALAVKYKDQTQKWLDINRKWAADGLRVLFFAYKIFDQSRSLFNDIVMILH